MGNLFRLSQLLIRDLHESQDTYCGQRTLSYTREGSIKCDDSQRRCPLSAFSLFPQYLYTVVNFMKTFRRRTSEHLILHETIENRIVIYKFLSTRMEPTRKPGATDWFTFVPQICKQLHLSWKIWIQIGIPNDLLGESQKDPGLIIKIDMNHKKCEKQL